MATPGFESVVSDEIREVLRAHGHLVVDIDQLAADADLFDAGMDSHSSVMVMLALEERFEVEFPDRMLRREVFQSISAIREAVAELSTEGATT